MIVVAAPNSVEKTSSPIIYGATVTLDSGRQYLGKVTCLPFGLQQKVIPAEKSGAKLKEEHVYFNLTGETKFTIMYNEGRSSAEFTVFRRKPASENDDSDKKSGIGVLNSKIFRWRPKSQDTVPPKGKKDIDV